MPSSVNLYLPPVDFYIYYIVYVITEFVGGNRLAFAVDMLFCCIGFIFQCRILCKIGSDIKRCCCNHHSETRQSHTLLQT